jgi:hypothetical protein
MARRAIAALIFCAAVAIVATWPLVLTPFHSIAGGPGDPVLGATILAWNADRARHAFRGFWDAPFLFPHRHVLAHAEHLIGIAVFTTPIEWITANPIFTYNLAYIGSYALAAGGMFLLARALWLRADAALLAGLAFAVTPYRLAQTSHLQVLMNGWMPIGLWALHRYFEGGLRRWLAAFATAFVLLGLSNGYYFYFFLLPVALVVASELASPRCPPRRMLLDLAVAGLAIAVVVSPVAWIYYGVQRERGLARTYAELAGLSAHLGDYFRVPYGAWTWGGLLARGDPERELFHGFVVIVFAAAGALSFVTSRRAGDGVRRRWIATYTALLVVAVWLSMGPGAARPYSLLYQIVPGLNGLRVVARLSTVVVLALAVLAGAGFAALLARLPRPAARVATLALASIILVEGQHGVGLTAIANPRDKTWERVAYDWLRHSPPGAALELNITRMDDFQPFTTMYQLNAVQHGHPIVNGYSGWSSVLQEFLGGPTSPLREAGRVAETLRGLRAIGVRFVLLHLRTYPDGDEAARLVQEIHGASDQIAEEHRFEDTWAWRLTDPDSGPTPTSGLQQLDPHTFALRASHQAWRLPFLTDGDIDTRWLSGDRQNGTEWIEIQLGRRSDIARVRLEVAPRSVADHPRRLTIESRTPSGATRTVFDGTVLERLIRGLAIDERRAPVEIDLPHNETETLTLRQTRSAPTWWSIHELTLWERR